MAWVSTNARPSRVAPLIARFVGFFTGAGVAWWVVVASLGLCTLGIVAIDVATVSEAGREISSTASKQLAFLLVGMFAACVAALPHYRWLGFTSWVLFALALASLVFLLLPFVPTSIVKPRNGARGWINFGPVDFQPAETAKVAYVLVLAWYLRYKSTQRNFLGLIPPAIITGIPVALITLQPDFGSALLFIPVLFAVLVAAGARLRHLAIVVAVATMASPAAYPFLKPHQKQRIVGLIQQIKGDTSADQDINMQPKTAQRLIGAGEITGIADAQARAVIRASRLPERHNDMIYAVIVNRWGLVGAVGLYLLYALWIGSALLTAASIREPFARLVIVGFATFILAQVFVNIGMNSGLLPIIGVTLPFVSYGGSSMISGWLMVGLIMGIAFRREGMPTRRSFEYSDDDEE